MADSASPTVDLLVQGWTLNTNEGRLGFCGVTLIEAGGRRILVDVAQVGRRVLILERLAARGLSPRDIDTVVMTHTHWDHLLNADVFEHAEFVVHKDERAYAREPHPNDWATPKVHQRDPRAAASTRGTRGRPGRAGADGHRDARPHCRLDLAASRHARRADLCLR